MEHATFELVADGDRTIARHRTPYEADIHAWAMEQAELIRLGRLHGLDADNLVDDAGDKARRVRHEFVGRLSLVVSHLLKWDHRSDRRSVSWARTIREQRRQLDELLTEAPSLRIRLPAMLEEAFKQGRAAALNQTGLDDEDIPEVNSYSRDDAMNRPIVWPER